MPSAISPSSRCRSPCRSTNSPPSRERRRPPARRGSPESGCRRRLYWRPSAQLTTLANVATTPGSAWRWRRGTTALRLRPARRRRRPRRRRRCDRWPSPVRRREPLRRRRPRQGRLRCRSAGRSLISRRFVGWNLGGRRLFGFLAVADLPERFLRLPVGRLGRRRLLGALRVAHRSRSFVLGPLRLFDPLLPASALAIGVDVLVEKGQGGGRLVVQRRGGGLSLSHGRSLADPRRDDDVKP